MKIKEKKVLELAKTAWGLALKEFYYPPLNEPRYVFDYTRKEGFFIDPDNQWQITMNLANIPLLKDDSELIQYFYAILLHEISHYQVIPYDGLINAKLLHAAMSHANSNFAPLIVNVFADLVIDTTLYRNNPDLMLWEFNKTRENLIQHYGNRLCNFSNFLFSTYEKLWNVELDSTHYAPEIESLADKVKDVVLDKFEDETLWETKVSKISYYLSKFLNTEFTFTTGGYRPVKGKSRRKVPGKNIEMEIPDDVLELMDDPLETKNSDRLKQDNDDELRQKAEDFAKDVPFSEFGAPAGQAGILIDGTPLATWYRGKAKNLLEIRIFEKKPSGELPIFPEKWRIGDPLEELDVVLTLLNSPVIIPNITTRKWNCEKGPGHLCEQELPDLLIVLDSSGSMQWNFKTKTEKEGGPYHIALMASFAILHYVATKGVKFSVINFSNFADTCDWTMNFHAAETVLLRYQGGGTQIPIKAIQNQIRKAEREVLVFIITDFGIHNWANTKKLMLQMVNQGHKIVGFFIGSKSIPKNKFKDLMNKVTFYPIENIKDLIHLVIQEIKYQYS